MDKLLLLVVLLLFGSDFQKAGCDESSAQVPDSDDASSSSWSKWLKYLPGRNNGKGEKTPDAIPMENAVAPDENLVQQPDAVPKDDEARNSANSTSKWDWLKYLPGWQKKPNANGAPTSKPVANAPDIDNLQKQLDRMPYDALLVLLLGALKKRNPELKPRTAFGSELNQFERMGKTAPNTPNSPYPLWRPKLEYEYKEAGPGMIYENADVSYQNLKGSLEKIDHEHHNALLNKVNDNANERSYYGDIPSYGNAETAYDQGLRAGFNEVMAVAEHERTRPESPSAPLASTYEQGYQDGVDSGIYKALPDFNPPPFVSKFKVKRC